MLFHSFIILFFISKNSFAYDKVFILSDENNTDYFTGTFKTFDKVAIHGPNESNGSTAIIEIIDVMNHYYDTTLYDFSFANIYHFNNSSIYYKTAEWKTVYNSLYASGESSNNQEGSIFDQNMQFQYDNTDNTVIDNLFHSMGNIRNNTIDVYTNTVFANKLGYDIHGNPKPLYGLNINDSLVLISDQVNICEIMLNPKATLLLYPEVDLTIKNINSLANISSGGILNIYNPKNHQVDFHEEIGTIDGKLDHISILNANNIRFRDNIWSKSLYINSSDISFIRNSEDISAFNSVNTIIQNSKLNFDNSYNYINNYSEDKNILRNETTQKPYMKMKNTSLNIGTNNLCVNGICRVIGENNVDLAFDTNTKKYGTVFFENIWGEGDSKFNINLKVLGNTFPENSLLLPVVLKNSAQVYQNDVQFVLGNVSYPDNASLQEKVKWQLVNGSLYANGVYDSENVNTNVYTEKGRIYTMLQAGSGVDVFTRDIIDSDSLIQSVKFSDALDDHNEYFDERYQSAVVMNKYNVIKNMAKSGLSIESVENYLKTYPLSFELKKHQSRYSNIMKLIPYNLDIDYRKIDRLIYQMSNSSYKAFEGEIIALLENSDDVSESELKDKIHNAISVYGNFVDVTQIGSNTQDRRYNFLSYTSPEVDLPGLHNLYYKLKEKNPDADYVIVKDRNNRYFIVGTRKVQSQGEDTVTLSDINPYFPYAVSIVDIENIDNTNTNFTTHNVFANNQMIIENNQFLNDENNVTPPIENFAVIETRVDFNHTLKWGIDGNLSLYNHNGDLIRESSVFVWRSSIEDRWNTLNIIGDIYKNPDNISNYFEEYLDIYGIYQILPENDKQRFIVSCARGLAEKINNNNGEISNNISYITDNFLSIVNGSTRSSYNPVASKRLYAEIVDNASDIVDAQMALISNQTDIQSINQKHYSLQNNSSYVSSGEPQKVNKLKTWASCGATKADQSISKDEDTGYHLRGFFISSGIDFPLNASTNLGLAIGLNSNRYDYTGLGAGDSTSSIARIYSGYFNKKLFNKLLYSASVHILDGYALVEDQKGQTNIKGYGSFDFMGSTIDMTLGYPVSYNGHSFTPFINGKYSHILESSYKQHGAYILNISFPETQKQRFKWAFGLKYGNRHEFNHNALTIVGHLFYEKVLFSNEENRDQRPYLMNGAMLGHNVMSTKNTGVFNCGVGLEWDHGKNLDVDLLYHTQMRSHYLAHSLVFKIGVSI